MYSIVLMAAMTSAPETPNFGRRGCDGGGGCLGAGRGCDGGGFLGLRRGRGGNCHGGNGGCYGGYSGWSGCHGGYAGHVGCHGGYAGHAGHVGCHGGYAGHGGYSGWSGGCHGSWGGGWSGAHTQTEPISVADAAPLTTTQATLIVTLPADAKLLVDSKPTGAQGAVRHFTTPPLEAGVDFTYTLTAIATRDGREVKAEKQVGVRAGEVTRLSLDIPREVARR